jgi:HK97 gp10 family phage protein
MARGYFEKLAAEVEPALYAALRKVAESIVEDAKARCPVDTGRLRDAIHIEERLDGIYIFGGDRKAWYGHMVEHGTVNLPGVRQHVGGNRFLPGATVRTAAHPFLLPAVEAHRAEIAEVAHAVIREMTA